MSEESLAETGTTACGRINSPQQSGEVGLRRLQTAPAQFDLVFGSSYQLAQADFAALLR